MLKLFKIFIASLVALIFTFAPHISFAQLIEPNFNIKDYHTQIDLNHDGTFVVTETIKLNFDSASSGFTRNIPLTIENKTSKGNIVDRFLNFELVSVERNGKPEVHTQKSIEQRSDGFSTQYFTNHYNVESINIGDPSQSVVGPNIYVIKYIIGNDLIGDHDIALFTWHAVDSTLNANIEQSSVSIDLADGTDTSKLTSAQCFIGAQNTSLESDCKKQPLTDKVFNAESLKTISTGEDFKVTVAFTSTYLGIDTYALGESSVIAENGITPLKLIVNTLLIFSPIIFIGLYIYILNRHNKKTLSKTSLYFNIPEDLKPAQAGLIYEQHFENIDLSATLIDLARRGYLNIHKKQQNNEVINSRSDYLFTKTNKDTIGMEDYEVTLYNGVFGQGSEIYLSSLEYKFYKPLHDINMDLRKWSFQSDYFNTKSWTRGNKIFGLLVIVFFFTVFTIIQGMFYENKIFTFIQCLFELIALVAATLIFVTINTRSLKGRKTRSMIQGLKRYLLGDGVKTKNKPSMDISVFEKFLPFALLFNFGESWAEQFGEIYITPPTWYTQEWEIFNTLSFVRSLTKASSDITAVLTTREIAKDGIED